MPKIEIFTRMLCPYCTRAKALIESKSVPYDEFDVTFDDALRAQMIERAHGCHTVPQIFIDGQHIGGSDALAALEAEGKLDPLLGR